MASKDSDDFRIRPGRPRSRGTRVRSRNLSFVQEVQAAIRKAGGNPNRIGRASSSAGGRKGGGTGRFNAHGRGAKALASFPRDSGGWQRDSIGRFRARRVVVKARVVKLAPQRGSRGPKMRGTASKAADAHLRYLERDGVTRDGEKGRAYSALENEADGRAFIERGREDRHEFRLIVAPEDSVEMDDLQGFTRNLMRQMERDLDTRLDWIAVDHHNTGHPHTHIIVRGVLDDGRILNIAGDYIAHGIRHRASELVTLELGPQTAMDLQNKLRQEVEAERLTRLDRMLIAEQQEHGVVDLRPDVAESYPIKANRHLLIDRACVSAWKIGSGAILMQAWSVTYLAHSAPGIWCHGHRERRSDPPEDHNRWPMGGNEPKTRRRGAPFAPKVRQSQFSTPIDSHWSRIGEPGPSKNSLFLRWKPPRTLAQKDLRAAARG